MPKMRTKKAAAKRLRLTSKGKIKHACTSRGHLLGSKSRKRKRHLRRGSILGAADHARIRALLKA